MERYLNHTLTFNFAVMVTGCLFQCSSAPVNVSAGITSDSFIFLQHKSCDKGRIVQIVNSLPNFAKMSTTIDRFNLEVVPKICTPKVTSWQRNF